MWIPRTRYDQLIRAEERALLLLARVNQLELEKADAVFKATGVPQRAMEMQLPVRVPAAVKTPRGIGTPFRHPDRVEDTAGGVVSFDDMGDDQARVEGIEVDDDGRITLPGMEIPMR